MQLPQRGGRALRVALAMGGGVSLGTFSGAALGEALKLLIAFGCYQDPKTGQIRRYREVVLDAFSGASAGALALAAMLRVLIQPEDYLEGGVMAKAGLPTLDKAEARIDSEYASVLAAEDDANRDRVRSQLAAAQLVQDVQHYAWGRRIGMDVLLGMAQQNDPDGAGGPGLPSADPTWQARSVTAPSLLNSDAVAKIASDILQHPSSNGKDQHVLLADRVLYACSLASFVPLRADARHQLLRGGAEMFERWAAATGGSSSPRRDLRVFDLFLKKVTGAEILKSKEVFPGRWVRYSVDKVADQTGSLFGSDAWKRIGATAIACGAFPLALSPVTLRRFHFEMAAELPDLIPPNDDPATEYPFTYIDGGLFNNQPVREAFRLAAFLDAHAPFDDYDRRLIHVTPNAGTLPSVLKVKALQDFTIQEVKARAKPLDAGEVNDQGIARRSTALRLIDQAGAVLGALLDQGRTREADRVAMVCNVFERRSMLRTLTLSQPVGELTDAMIDELWNWCKKQLDELRRTAMVPPGTLSVEEELARVAGELSRSQAAHLGVSSITMESILSFTAKRGSDPNAPLLFKLLQLVALDIALDLSGKDELARLISIAPIVLDGTTPNPNLAPGVDPTSLREVSISLQSQYRRYQLPGGPIFGLMGFMIRSHRAHERDVARHAAKVFLQWGGVLPPLPDGVAPPQSPRTFTKAELRELSAMYDKLIDRVKDVLKDAKELNIPCLGRVLINGIIDKIAGSFDNASKREAMSQEVLVRVRLGDGLKSASNDVKRSLRLGTLRPDSKSIGSDGFKLLEPGADPSIAEPQLIATWTRLIEESTSVWKWRFTPLDGLPSSQSDDVVVEARVNGLTLQARVSWPSSAPGESPAQADMLRRLNASPLPQLTLVATLKGGQLSLEEPAVPFESWLDIESLLKV
jgi:hypothetical protein